MKRMMMQQANVYLAVYSASNVDKLFAFDNYINSNLNFIV